MKRNLGLGTSLVVLGGSIFGLTHVADPTLHYALWGGLWISGAAAGAMLFPRTVQAPLPLFEPEPVPRPAPSAYESQKRPTVNSGKRDSAYAELLDRLSRHRLSARDLTQMEALAQPLAGRLLQTIEAHRQDRVTRSNALIVLERIRNRLSPGDLEFLRGFVQRELDWLVATHYDLQALERSNEREALELVRFYLRQQQRSQAAQLLTARSILLQVERELDPSLLRASFHALLHPGEGDVAVSAAALSQWAGDSFSQAFQLVVGVAPSPEAPPVGDSRSRNVEDLCLEYLSRDDRWLVCCTLHGLGELARRKLRLSPLAPGTPASEALKLADSPDGDIREAALECLAAMYDGTPLPESVEAALQRASTDLDLRIQELGKALLAAVETKPVS